MSDNQEMPLPTHGESPPIFNVPASVLGVIGLLCAVHALFWLLGDDWHVWSLYALSFIPSRLGGTQPVPYPEGAQVWSFFTYALLHADVFHLLANCLWLLIFSTPLARRWGGARFVVFLALAAVAGAATMLLGHWGEFIVVIGASAAVSAAFSAVMPLMFSPGFGLRPRPEIDYKVIKAVPFLHLLKNPRALAFSAVFLVLSLFAGASQYMTGTAFLEERSIAWEAHLGGFAAGLVLFYLVEKTLFPSTTKI